MNKNNYKLIPATIKNTPALINSSDNHIEIGTYNIINYLITLCEGSPYNENNESGDTKSVKPENKSTFLNEIQKISIIEKGNIYPHNYHTNYDTELYVKIKENNKHMWISYEKNTQLPNILQLLNL